MDAETVNLAGILRHAADSHGGRLAISERQREHTFAELAGRAGAIAEGLLALGALPGDRIAVYLERNADAVAALFAAYSIGAIAVMVSEYARPLQVEYVLGHSGASVLVSTAEVLARQVRPVRGGATLLDVALLPQSGRLEPVPRSARDIAQIIYTSGSTGPPKGVVHSHGGLRAGARAVSGYLGIDASDKVALLVPLGFVMGLNQVISSFSVGAGLVIERGAATDDLVGALAARGTTVLPGVPPLWAQLVALPSFRGGELRRARTAQCSGGYLPIETMRALRAALPETRLFVQYGMTETFRSAYLPPEELDRRPGSMGKALPGVELMLLDADDRPVPAGVVGELVHRGPSIALGYWNDPEATRRVFRSNPSPGPGSDDEERVVYTGDLARRDEDGFLYFVGRSDSIIKSMGFRVGPDEIAQGLLSSGEADEAVIDSEPDPDTGARIIAHVVLREGGSLARLKRYCRAEMPVYAQPLEYIAWPRLPRLSNGKYDLDAVRRGPDRAGPLA